VFNVHKVAESAAGARVLIKIAAARLPKIRDRTVFAFHGPSIVVPTAHHLKSVCGLLFVGELDVDMSHHVVSKVVADVEVVDASELSKLSDHILVELQETLLGLRLVNDCTPPVTSHGAGYFRLPHWVRVYVPNKDRLAECWPVVKPATSVTVPACADLEEKGAVHLVFFCAVNASEVRRTPWPLTRAR